MTHGRPTPINAKVPRLMNQLRDELDEQIFELNEGMADAAADGDYDAVEYLLIRARLTTEWLARVESLISDSTNNTALELDLYAEIMKLPTIPSDPGTGTRNEFGRIGRGQKTQAEYFAVPILRSLVELGGTARSAVVIDRVGPKVSHLFNNGDLGTTTMSMGRPRWEQTVHFAKRKLVGLGYISDGTSKGTWEITAAGRAFLAKDPSEIVVRRAFAANRS